MSLFSTERYNFPSKSSFQRREKIPEAERCTSCDGLGVCRDPQTLNDG